MFNRLAIICGVWTIVSAGRAAGQGSEPFRLVEGDRVVLLGNALIEHERFHGYIETRLLRHTSAAKITFRNLGWSGDTVRGDARTSGYENPEGISRLLKEMKALKPSVILLGYGMNESFAGPAGVSIFVKEYAKLLDYLAPLKARIVVLSPTWHENLGPPLPDPAEHNRSLEEYIAALKQFATKRRLAFVDLHHPLAEAKRAAPAQQLTSNGILLNDLGYWHVAAAIERQLGLASPRVEWNSADKNALLTPPPSPSGGPAEETLLVVRGLGAGRHVLKFDGKSVAAATAAEWEAGVRVKSPALDADIESLRKAIVLRNDLYYRGWRPYNDHSRHWTYMAKDFATFDELAARQDSVIEVLRRPVRAIEIIEEGKAK